MNKPTCFKSHPSYQEQAENDCITCDVNDKCLTIKRDAFDIADEVIEQTYPNIYGLEKGMWGHQRIQNYGALRGAIAKAILKDRKNS